MVKSLVNRVRRNHALEHATIAIMLNRLGPMRVVGRAAHDGFYIYGNVATDKLRGFADEALHRLQRGEAHLAVSPLCGTNLVVAGVLAGLGSYLGASAGRKGLDRFSTAMFAAILGMLAAQPVGRLIQQRYTTSPDLHDVRIVAVDRMAGGKVHKVRTTAAA
jgi:hypothetical protein